MGVLIKLRDCESLSPAEAQVRDVIIEDPRSVLNSTVYELAEAAYTSPSTVSRLCKRVGISGYASLRLLLAEEVHHLETIDLDYLDTTTIEPTDSPAEVVEKLTSISVKTIQETHELVDMDALAQAVSLLHSYGHRKIGLFLSGDQTRHTREVKTAFMEQCEYYNMEHEIGPGLEKLQKQYYRYGSVRELVESGVTAIIANGESESTEVLAGIQLCGKVVPRDISLICWEVPSFSKFLNPPLTTISQDFPRLAATAFTLLEQIAHKENPPFSIQVDCLLTERNSVTVPPPGR